MKKQEAGQISQTTGEKDAQNGEFRKILPQNIKTSHSHAGLICRPAGIFPP
jgi:hypothetical protein